MYIQIIFENKTPLGELDALAFISLLWPLKHPV